MVWLRYRGLSNELPSVSKFRSGHMPSGMNVSRVIDDLSESDNDTCSDSEGECYGNASCLGTRLDSLVRRGTGFSAVPHRFAGDESSESATSSEVNSTPSRSNNGGITEKKLQSGANFSRFNECALLRDAFGQRKNF